MHNLKRYNPGFVNLKNVMTKIADLKWKLTIELLTLNNYQEEYTKDGRLNINKYRWRYVYSYSVLAGFKCKITFNREPTPNSIYLYILWH